MKTNGKSHGVSTAFRFIGHLKIKDADYSYSLFLMRGWSDHDRLCLIFFFLFWNIQILSFAAHVGREITLNSCLVH